MILLRLLCRIGLHVYEDRECVRRTAMYGRIKQRCDWCHKERLVTRYS